MVAAGSVNGVLSGHHYNRSIYAHKVVLEALQRLRFAAFIESLTNEDLERYEDVLHEKNISLAELEESVDIHAVMVKYKEFVTKMSRQCVIPTG